MNRWYSFPLALPALASISLAAACDQRSTPGYDYVAAAACPDGTDLLVRFVAEDGLLRAEACCGQAGDGTDMRRQQQPDLPFPRGWADSMRKQEPAEPRDPGPSASMRREQTGGPAPRTGPAYADD